MIAVRLVNETMSRARDGDHSRFAAINEVRERSFGAVFARHQARRSPSRRIRIAFHRVSADGLPETNAIARIARAGCRPMLVEIRAVAVERLPTSNIQRKSAASQDYTVTSDDMTRAFRRLNLGTRHGPILVLKKGLNRTVQPQLDSEISRGAEKPGGQSITIRQKLASSL